MPAQQPAQYLFVSRRAQTIRSTLGGAISFEKGVPTHVPKYLHAAVMEKGIMPCDEKGQELDAVTASEVAPEEPRLLVAPEDNEERLDAIKNACREIAKRNNSKDFTAGGNPSASAVSLALGWKVDQKDVRQAWIAIREEVLAQG